MAEVEEDNQVHMVQSHKVQKKRGEPDHGIKQEEGNYCYIDLLGEEQMQVDKIEAAKIEVEKREKENVHLEENNEEDPEEEKLRSFQ